MDLNFLFAHYCPEPQVHTTMVVRAEIRVPLSIFWALKKSSITIWVVFTFGVLSRFCIFIILSLLSIDKESCNRE